MIELDKIYCMDFKDGEKLIDDDSIDLVFTDPPYPKKYLYTFQYLADFCPRIMKHGASLVTLLGHYELEQVMDMFHGKLKYRWILCMNQFGGSHPRMAMGIEVLWKPMLWYVKGSYPSGRGFLRDGIEITGKNGQTKSSGHKWEQDSSWADYYIEKLTKPNGVVLDPFMGSGTVAEACIKTNRRFIGFDISQEYCDIANERINNLKQQNSYLTKE